MASQFLIPTGSANQAGRVPAPVLQPQPQASDHPPLLGARPAGTVFLASVPGAGAAALAPGAHASSAVAYAPRTEPKDAEEAALMADRIIAYEVCMYEMMSAGFGNRFEVPGLESIINGLSSWMDDGGTALFLAAESGHEKFAEQLIENGAKVDLQDLNGRTALHAAARQGNVSMMRLLLDCGADLHHKDADGRTALSHAAECNNQAAFNLLLAKGARIEDVDKLGRAAIWYGHSSLVARLLTDGVRIDCTGMGGRRLLDRLIKGDQQQAIPALLQLGLDCNLEDQDGQSPLDMAAGYNRTATVRALLQHGADVNHVSGKERQTPLFKAVSFDFRAVLDALIASATIKLDHQDIDGRTALHLAAGRNRPYALIRLLDKGAAIDLQDHEGNTALSTACACGHWHIARALVARGASYHHGNGAGLILAKDGEQLRPLPALDPSSGQANLGFVEMIKGFGVIGQLENALDWKDWLTCQGVGWRTIEALARAAAAQATVLKAMTGYDDEIVQPALQTVACAGMLAGLTGGADKDAGWVGISALAAAGLAAEATWRKDLSALHHVCEHASAGGRDLTPVALYRYLTGVHGMAGLFAQEVASAFFLARLEKSDLERPLAFARKLRQVLESSYFSDKLAQSRAASGNPETFDRLMRRQRDMLDAFCASTLENE